MQRLFIALDLPEDIRLQVFGMGTSLGRTRPVPLEQIHLTLKFIGDVDGATALDIRDSLATISHFVGNISLKAPGVFPPRGNPRVLWVGIEPQDQVRRLHRKIENCLQAIGVEREKRKFTPHITLARFGDKGVKHLAEFLAGNSFFSSPLFMPETFTLYASQLTPKGAIHTPIKSYVLTPTEI